MTLVAGQVVAILGGRFVPTGFAQFDGALKRSAANAAASEKAIVTSNRRSADSMSTVGVAANKAAGIGLAAFAAGISVSVKNATDFEKRMRNVNSIARLSERDFGRLGKSVIQLSKDTGQSATTLADGLYTLVSSGFDARDSMSILESSSRAAAAGLTTTEVSTKAVAAVLNAYKLPATQAARVSDDLFQTVKLGVISFEELAQNIGDVLPFAQSLGVDLKQVGAGVSTLTKAGVSAPETMTRLKGAMVALLKPSDAMEATFKKLGVTTGQELIGKTGSFQGAIQALAGAVGNNKQAMAELFPDIRGLGAAYLLTGQNARAASADLSGFANTQGATSQVLAEQSKSLSFQWGKLKAEATALSIAVGQELVPALTDAARGANQFMRDAEDGKGAGGAFADVLGAFKKASNISWDFLGEGVKATKYLGGAIDALVGGGPKKKDIRVTAKLADQVTPGLIRIQQQRLSPKVARILADDSSAQAKIARLRALGINGPTARFLAQTGSVDAAISAVAGRSITIPVNFKAQPFSATPPKAREASGGGGSARTALIGEGNAGEWVGGPDKGWSWVDRPMIAGLGADDYVIPTEQRYRGRALELMADALGLPGFKGGKTGKFKGKGKKRRYIPAPQERFAADPAELREAADAAEQRYDRLRDKAKERDKNKKLTKGAKEARGKLGSSRDAMVRAKAIYREANDYAARIRRREDLIEIGRSDMQLADQADDPKAYAGARGKRSTEIRRLMGLYRTALAKAPKGSKWRRELLKKLRQAEVDLGDNQAEKINVDGGSTFTDAEQARLDGIDSEIALADLTATKSDDAKWLGEKLGFLRPLLASAQSNPGARGGASAITEIAGMVKSTEDALKAASAPPDVTADQQAQADQAFQRGLAQGRGATVDRLAAAVMGGGFGGPSVVFQSYVPPSPQEARRLADYTVGGIGGQGITRAPTTRVGA
jgi:TP901 family phage tail tape measure protein